MEVFMNALLPFMNVFITLYACWIHTVDSVGEYSSSCGTLAHQSQMILQRQKKRLIWLQKKRVIYLSSEYLHSCVLSSAPLVGLMWTGCARGHRVEKVGEAIRRNTCNIQCHSLYMDNQCCQQGKFLLQVQFISWITLDLSLCVVDKKYKGSSMENWLFPHAHSANIIPWYL